MPTPHAQSRRAFLIGSAGAAAVALAGCSTTIGSRRVELPDFGDMDFFGSDPGTAALPGEVARMYAAIPDERFPIPAVDPRQLKPAYVRTQVVDPTGERPGTIVVVTPQRYLYLVQEGGRAMRYGIGVGREGFSWSGRATVARKAAWPTWTPTRQMMEREPETRQYASGMPPGLTNPLGARALYIHQDGRDTLYRIHGTPEVWSIGEAVSSGCVRLINQDVIDLYGRCPVGTPIVVRT